MARIKDNRPVDEEGRVRLRKSVIRAATAFIDGYKRPRDITPPRVSECTNLLERKTDENR